MDKKYKPGEIENQVAEELECVEFVQSGGGSRKTQVLFA